jgi:phosphopantetheinyl transferase
MVNLFVEPISPIFACCDRLITASDVASASRFQNESRRAEHLSWRRIVRRELGRGVAISYNDVGAPIVDTPNIYISIAHAKERMVAVAIADSSVGIDIEAIDRDFRRVASRYMSAEEQGLSTDEAWYAVVWCAKEAMYKLRGRRGVDLTRDMHVVSYDATLGKGVGVVDGCRVLLDIKIVDNSYVVVVATYM